MHALFISPSPVLKLVYATEVTSVEPARFEWYDVTWKISIFFISIALFPGPIQLSVACSMVKREGAWYLFYM